MLVRYNKRFVPMSGRGRLQLDEVSVRGLRYRTLSSTCINENVSRTCSNCLWKDPEKQECIPVSTYRLQKLNLHPGSTKITPLNNMKIIHVCRSTFSCNGRLDKESSTESDSLALPST